MLHYSPKLFKRLWWGGKLAFHCFMDLREEWLIQQQTGNLQQGKGQTHTESHLAHLQGGDTITSSSPCCTWMRLPASWLSLPRIPWLCMALATEPRDERRRMQTSEEQERLRHKENTANSVLIIHTPGLASSSSFTQTRIAGEGRRCFPVLGVPASPASAISCMWSMALMPQRTGSGAASSQLTHFETQPQ